MLNISHSKAILTVDLFYEKCEVYLHDTIDVTKLMGYIEKKNTENPEYKMTLFYCAVTGLARMVKEQPM